MIPVNLEIRTNMEHAMKRLLAGLGIAAFLTLPTYGAQTSTQDKHGDSYARGDWAGRSAYCRGVDLCGEWFQPAWAEGSGNRFGLRLDLGRASPNGFFKVAKLFIDNLQVAEIGPVRVKVSIAIE